MTYCLALNLNAGLVLLADSRTNAGLDNISTFSKLFSWQTDQGAPSPRAIAMMASGNLSITQEVVALIEEQTSIEGGDSILTQPNMFRVAERFGDVMSAVQARRRPGLSAAGIASGATLLVAGQISGERTRLFMVYDAGNFIEATPDAPFLQIGEFKYGKPILDRVINVDTSLENGVKAALLSMDATIRSNLSVGAPLDLAATTPGSFAWRRQRIKKKDEIWQAISDGWAAHLRTSFSAMPDIPL